MLAANALTEESIGEKNKYYATIYAEDDEEADAKNKVESIEDEEDAVDPMEILREQEREEEEMRLQVEEVRQ